MVKHRMTMMSLALAGVMVGWTGAAHATDPEDVAVMRGILIAKRNCSQCHSLVVGEKSPNAHAPPFHDLQRRFPGDSLMVALDRGLLTHTREMPELRLTPAELSDLKAYFRMIQAEGQRLAVLTPGRGGPVRK